MTSVSLDDIASSRNSEESFSTQNKKFQFSPPVVPPSYETQQEIINNRLGTLFPSSSLETPRSTSTLNSKQDSLQNYMFNEYTFPKPKLTRGSANIFASAEEKRKYILEVLDNLCLHFDDYERIKILQEIESKTMTAFLSGTPVGFIRNYDLTKKNCHIYDSPYDDKVKIVYVVEDHYDDGTVTIRDDRNNQHRVFRGALTRFTDSPTF